MKIFVITSRIPWPLEKGDKLRIYHQLKHLSKNNEIFLCCLSDEKLPADGMENLKSICSQVEIIPLNKLLIIWRMFLAIFSDRPFQVHYFYQRHVRKRIYELVKQFQPDHIYCQLIRAAEHVKHIHEVPKTLDYMDAFNKGVERRIAKSSWIMKRILREEFRRLVAYENLIYEYFEHHVIISEQDRDFIFHPQRKEIAVIPNGVDQEFFHPINKDKKYHLVFTGNMNYPPNVDSAILLAEKILPLVQKTIPEANLLIAGAQPSNQVKSLQSKDVTVTGWMDDIRDAYAESHVFLAPMQIGSGLQNKLLEAMSMKLPCITSRLANNALGAEDGKDILIGHHPEDFAKLAIELLQNPDRAASIAESGQRFVSQAYSWEHSSALLEELMLGK